MILLVDDDAGSNYETYFTEALNANGYAYDVWDVNASGSPGAGDLMNYRVVIWTTGDDYSNTLTSTDQSNLMSYLDNGGRLYLSSQDLLWDISGGNDGAISNTFVNNYLHVTSVSNDVSYSTVSGVSGDPITGNFSTVTLSYPSGYTNYADEIEIDSTAIAIFTNPNTGNVVADRVDTGTYRLVFTAFSFEAVENGDSSVGAELMGNIITWLLGGGAGTPSEPLNPTATAGIGYINVTWDPPTNDGGSAIEEYLIYRKAGDAGTYVLIGTVPASQTWYNDTSVNSNTTYYYYITAKNSVGEGPPSTEVSATPAIPEINTFAIIIAGMLVIAGVTRMRRR